MVKKLLLFAILSPLAMQPVMKADGLISSIAYNFSHPWTETATKGVNNCASFNTKLDLVTLGLTFASMAYRTAVGSKAADQTFFGTTFPKLLCLHDLFKAGTTFHAESKNGLAYSASLAKLFILITSKIPSRDHQTRACDFFGFPVWKR